METTRIPNDQTTVATYAFDGANRRMKKVVTNCGVEAVANDGGDTTVHYYYDNQWRILETRNGSNQATWQYVWGTQYTDEIVLADKNADGSGDDCNPDNTEQGETTYADKRYFYHQDRNWNVVALSYYDAGGLTLSNGAIVERYSYTPYGEFIVLKGQTSGNAPGNVLIASNVGNVFAHQGLPTDHEKGSYQNRWREYNVATLRFMLRDPRSYLDGMNLYGYLSASPVQRTDAPGLASLGGGGFCELPPPPPPPPPSDDGCAERFFNCMWWATVENLVCNAVVACKCTYDFPPGLARDLCIARGLEECLRLEIELKAYCADEFSDCIKKRQNQAPGGGVSPSL